MQEEKRAIWTRYALDKIDLQRLQDQVLANLADEEKRAQLVQTTVTECADKFLKGKKYSIREHMDVFNRIYILSWQNNNDEKSDYTFSHGLVVIFNDTTNEIVICFGGDRDDPQSSHITFSLAEVEKEPNIQDLTRMLSLALSPPSGGEVVYNCELVAKKETRTSRRRLRRNPQ